ncbi:MAG: hypothetical protein COU09_00500 [Candidatus Harrisonbacteria bacterium CG10_big_fil_rev_8_21_14_0_10_44_23]|uniref:Uncharacterized protein n=1 Tax=Candidatus Harrisonbacteria bacterium CG10_big_fil_rev_8_21_14_0_10_44_23 TaxID=1974585 RepID=A0A2H0UQP3_9BACT|nr:MAG: hypothetical protein COU09_00500 [Candidatus Harrisonbacteria bacterium CG10_big_fil_rev_8_21_14_0_10_44_23]
MDQQNPDAKTTLSDIRHAKKKKIHLLGKRHSATKDYAGKNNDNTLLIAASIILIAVLVAILFF